MTLVIPSTWSQGQVTFFLRWFPPPSFGRPLRCGQELPPSSQASQTCWWASRNPGRRCKSTHLRRKAGKCAQCWARPALSKWFRKQRTGSLRFLRIKVPRFTFFEASKQKRSFPSRRFRWWSRQRSTIISFRSTELVYSEGFTKVVLNQRFCWNV